VVFTAPNPHYWGGLTGEKAKTKKLATFDDKY